MHMNFQELQADLALFRTVFQTLNTDEPGSAWVKPDGNKSLQNFDLEPLFWKALFLCVSAYPVHVEGEEDLVHVAVGVLAHPLEVEDGLELEQRDEAGRRLSHEHVVPVVHVLGEDVVQVRAVVPH